MESETNPLLKPIEKSFQDKFHLLLTFFLKGETLTPNRFKQENLAAQHLLKSYPDFDFFYEIPDLYNQFNSLWGLNTKYWREEIRKRYVSFVEEKEKKKEFVLSDTNLVNLDVKPKENKNLIDFVREQELKK